MLQVVAFSKYLNESWFVVISTCTIHVSTYILLPKLAFQGKQKQESMKKKLNVDKLVYLSRHCFVNRESKFDHNHPAGDVLCWLSRAKIDEKCKESS